MEPLRTEMVCFKCKAKFNAKSNITVSGDGKPCCPVCGRELFEIIRNENV